ncbi:ABC transporter permease [uncultured Clostridium sp.]|jgi:ABC-2 type transport system permease protein|uniref:ABC transporter permease n=1 Tax=uncultured Clostridium sp. TaxID=59620 RepID=UPI00260780FE|nr:ABC transporter permease [uncultured Clostridium sp.]
MIKKMYNLTTNELTKFLVKPSILIIIALIFISSILVPLIPKAIMSHEAGFTTDMYHFQLGAINGEVKGLNTKKVNDKNKETFLKSQKAQVQLLIDSKVEATGWRYNVANEYLMTLTQIDTIHLLKENITPATILASLPPQVSPQTIKETLAIPSSEYASALKKLDAKKTKLYNDVKNNNYIGYFTKEITSNKAQVKNLEKELTALNAKLKKEPTSMDLKTQITKLNDTINTLNSIIKIDQYRVDHKIPFSKKNWKSATLTNLEQLAGSSQTQMATKTQFLSSPHKSVTYEQYVAKFKQDQMITNNKIKANWYSLEHNIPQTQFQNASSRDVTNSFVALYSMIAIVFTLILASGLISAEFSKGTIKLLLIRPVSRFKILLSKLIAVYIIGYFVLFGSMILLTISSGILFGFSDYLTPILKISSGVIVTHAYIGSLILAILYLSLSVLLFTTLAFTLSIVTKSTAASLASSLIIFIGAPIITIILFTKDFIWFDITPLPYLNLPFVGVIKVFSSMFNSKAILSHSLGGIEVAILTIILAIIGFVVFIKSDVNS